MYLWHVKVNAMPNYNYMQRFWGLCAQFLPIMRELSMSFSWLCATHFFHLSQKLAKLIHRIHIYNSASTGAEKK